MLILSDDFQQLVEASPSLIALLDDTRMVYINAAGANLLGTADGSSLAGASILDFIHPDDQRAFLNNLTQLETQTVDMALSLEARVVRAAQQETRWTSFYMRPILINDRRLCSVTGFDVSGYALSNRRLQAFEHQFTTLFFQSPNGVMLINPGSGVIMRCNPAAAQILRQDKEEVLGKHFDTVFPPASPDSNFQTRLNTDQAWSESRLFQQRDGTITPLVITLSYTLWNKHGAVVIAILHDISARMAAETERREQEVIQRAYEKERELFEMKNRFMSIVSHEFRTPLATIQTSAELLENYYERMSPERRNAGFLTIKDQIRYLTDMLEDIAILVKTESGRLFFAPVAMDVIGFCQSLIDELQSEIHTTHRIELNTAGDFPQMPMDPVLLRYILRNLLTNAVKYSPGADTIQFEVARPGTGSIVFRVIDFGIGIPTTDQDTLFLAYARASNAGTVRGSGLGLRIAREAAHLHGGDIRFVSEEGKGTTFIVSLPDPLASAPA
jgi:PAS domain S-box-containing protein